MQAKAGKKSQRKKATGQRLSPLNDLGEDGGTLAVDVKKPIIATKKDLVEAVRQIKPSHSAPSLRPEKKTSSVADILPETSDSTVRELGTLEDGVHMYARRYNELKMEADRKHAELDKLLDKLNDLHLEKSEMDMHCSGKTAESARIKQLQDEVLKVQKDMENKLFYRRQLQHMTLRQTRNQMAFDAHINGMEEALAISSKEYEEVKLLLRQLEAGRTQSHRQLQSAQAEIEMERGARTQAIADRTAEAEASRQIEHWRKKREHARSEYAAEMRGDMSKDEETALMTRLDTQVKQQEQAKREHDVQSKKAFTLEEAFQQIRQATGVRSLDEMVEKFMGQGANTAALESEKREAEARLVAAKERKEELHQQFMEMKASGIGGTELNREVYDKMDEQILQAKAALKVHKAACDRLEAVLVAVRQGAMGLAQQLTPFKGLVEHHEELNVPHSGIESLDSLHMSELKLTKMVEATGQPAGGGSSFNHLSGDGEQDAMEDAQPEVEDRPWSPLNDDLGLSSNNLRVTSVKEQTATEFGTAGDDSDYEEEEEEDTSAVPNRAHLKSSSHRKYNETLRRNDVKKQKEDYLARQQEGGGDDPNSTSLKMRKKHQVASSIKLSTQPASKKLGNPRDDAMTKSSVFITTVPDLE